MSTVVIVLVVGVISVVAALAGLLVYVDRRHTRATRRREFHADPSPWVVP